MAFGRRKRHDTEATEPRAATCAHTWRPRNLTAALRGAVCTVCDRCGAVWIIDADQGRRTEAERTPGGVAGQRTSQPAEDVGAPLKPAGQERSARHASAQALPDRTGDHRR